MMEGLEEEFPYTSQDIVDYLKKIREPGKPKDRVKPIKSHFNKNPLKKWRTVHIYELENPERKVWVLECVDHDWNDFIIYSTCKSSILDHFAMALKEEEGH